MWENACFFKKFISHQRGHPSNLSAKLLSLCLVGKAWLQSSFESSPGWLRRRKRRRREIPQIPTSFVGGKEREEKKTSSSRSKFWSPSYLLKRFMVAICLFLLLKFKLKVSLHLFSSSPSLFWEEEKGKGPLLCSQKILREDSPQFIFSDQTGLLWNSGASSISRFFFLGNILELRSWNPTRNSKERPNEP